MAQSIDGGVTIVNTLTVKNNGNYPLVMAESVQLAEGKTVEQKMGELEAGAGNEIITEDEINGLF
ncbi:MAG: hypothetical protein Q4B39_08080 [[Ruminococcus] gnavus]|nr:hypothetical protein [Mediterraneibacter gnavus]